MWYFKVVFHRFWRPRIKNSNLALYWNPIVTPPLATELFDLLESSVKTRGWGRGPSFDRMHLFHNNRIFSFWHHTQYWPIHHHKSHTTHQLPPLTMKREKEIVARQCSISKRAVNRTLVLFPETWYSIFRLKLGADCCYRIRCYKSLYNE